MATTSNELKQHGDTFTETTESPNVGSSADNSDGSSSPKTSNEQDGNHNPDQTEDIFAETRAIFLSHALKSPQCKTSDQIDRIIYVISKWDTGDDKYPNCIDIRKANKDGYKLIKKYVVQSSALDNSTIHQLHLKNPTHGSRVVPVEDIFDIILHCHVESAVHQKVRRTHNVIKKTYANITEVQVSMFIKECCTVCNLKLKANKATKGASHPIKKFTIPC